MFQVSSRYMYNLVLHLKFLHPVPPSIFALINFINISVNIGTISVLKSLILPHYSAPRCYLRARLPSSSLVERVTSSDTRIPPCSCDWEISSGSLPTFKSPSSRRLSFHSHYKKTSISIPAPSRSPLGSTNLFLLQMPPPSTAHSPTLCASIMRLMAHSCKMLSRPCHGSFASRNASYIVPVSSAVPLIP